jgi:hypothetical protein
MYDTALACIDHQLIKHQPKKSLFNSTSDDAEPKADESSLSTASSDGTHGHDETYGSLQTEKHDSATSFLGGVIRESTVNLKKGAVGCLQKSWRAIRGVKPAIEIFLDEARYPSEVRTTC